MFARSVCLLAAACAALTTGMAAQAPPAIEVLLERVGQRIERYYRQAQNIVFTEKATVQPIRSDFGPHGFARSTESEVRVEAVAFNDGEDSADATVVRQLLKVNGRPPREKDKKDRGACLDSNPLSPEPLSFLLPAHRGKYSFKYAGFGKGKDANALIIDFTLPKTGTPEIAEDPEGRAGCFRFSLPVAFKGRVLIDATSYEVLRIEQHMVGPADMKVGLPLQRKHDLPGVMVIERYDMTIRYKVVAFKDPEEALLLPESIETLDMYRGGLESHRRRQSFSEYRRFLTGGRVVKE
jgi:hypothetical protein